MPRAVTVTLRGEGAALLLERAQASRRTPEEFLLLLLQREARQSEGLKAAWARPGRREALSTAMKEGWARAKARKAALAEPEATPEPEPEAANGHH